MKHARTKSDLLAELEAAQQRILELELSLNAYESRSEPDEQGNSKLARVLDLLPVGISILDENRKIVFQNSVLSNILDLSAEELNSGSYKNRRYLMADGMPMPSDGFASVQAVQKGEAVHNVETGIVKENGETIWTNVSAMPINMPGWKTLIVTADITGRKRIESQREAALEKLSESEERYTLLFSKSTIPAVLLKLPEVVIADVNEAAEKLSGYRREEMLGKTAAELGLITHQQRTQDIETFWTAGKLAENERQVFTKSGEERIVVSKTNRLELAGQPYAITTLEDVTDRKRAEIKRDHLAERLDLATRAAKLGIWDWNIVKNEIVWDDQMYALYGLQPGDFGGAYEAWLHGLHPEDRDSSNEVSAAAVRGEREYDTEFRVRWPDGSVHWLKANGRVFRDKNGAPLRMVGVNYDITERKRAEEAIERTRNTLAEAQKIAHLGSFEYIAATQTTVWSEEEYRIYGLDPAGTSPEYNTMLQNCIHPDDAALLHETFTKAMLSNSVYELEHRIVRPDGSVRWVYDRAMPYLNERGEIIRYVGITLDITERKLMEDELRRSNAELEQFAYVASHDLQEPLRAMAGMVQLLQQRYKGKLDERADEYINHAVEASTRMQALINDLLTYSRVDRRGKPFELISLQKCVEAALKNLEVAVRESHARVTWGSLPTVRAESGQLVQVFQNLVGNAIKFRGGREPQIHIEGKRLEDAWQISVCDNGIGIEAQYFERIFQVFQRLHTRVEYPGTGIGLALCKKIIERHSGTIWVESQPGEGSTFHFTIPIRRKSDETQLQS